MGSEHDRMDQGIDRGQSAGAAGSPTPDDVLQVLAEFERGLSGLGKLYEQRQQLQSALQERLASVERREARVREAVTAAEGTEAELSRRRAELEREGAALASERERLAGIARGLEAESHAIEMRQKDTERLRAEDDERKRLADMEAERQSAQVAVLRAECAKLQTELSEREAGLESRRIELDRREADLSAAHDARQSGMEAESRRLADAEGRLGEARVQIERERAEIGLERGRIETRAEEIARAESRAAELSSACKEHERRVEELLAQVVQATEQRETARADAERLRLNAATLESRCQRAEKSLEDFKAQMAGDAAAAAEPLARLTRELEEAAAERDDLRRRAVEATDRLKAMEARQRHDRELISSEAEVREQALAALRAGVSELESRLAESQKQLGIEKRRADELQGRAPAGEAQCGVSGPDAARLEARRRRLAQYRRAAAGHAAKVRKAGEALQRRYEMCEQVLGQRADLAAAKQALGAAHAVIERRRAGGRAVGVVFFLVLTLATLGALSWALAWSFFPGSYVAHVTLRADNPSRELNAAELAAWTKYHADQLSDPQFIAVAAERMMARGLTALGTPGALTERMSADLRHGSAEPGTIGLELAGQGAAPTTRELTQVAAALASFANDRRFTRADGAATRVDGDVGIVGPFDKSRVFGAGGIFGVLTVLVLGLTGLIWHKLSSAKTMFEGESALNELLDETRWPDLKAG